MHSSSRMKGRQPVKQTAAADQPEPGILPHNHKDKPFSEPTASRGRELREHERGIGLGLKPHPKRMAMHAAPDHGDHQ